jgi:hypothetical protein
MILCLRLLWAVLCWAVVPALVVIDVERSGGLMAVVRTPAAHVAR